jgi:voltage-gated potassium channel
VIRLRVLAALGLVVAITAIGTIGYVVIEGASWLDGLYMTVITLSTVGFKEAIPLTQAGKLFTIFLIVGGVGVVVNMFRVLGEQIVEARLRDNYLGNVMQRHIDQLENHVIICGYGRFGRVVADEIVGERMPLVIVERDPDKEPALVRLGVDYVIGTALDDDVLARAGVERARSLVVATSSDADNVFITLAARERNPRIHIHARAESDSVERRLLQAGADRVLSTYHAGGLRMAASILRPSVVDFLEISSPRQGEAVYVEEMRIPARRCASVRLAHQAGRLEEQEAEADREARDRHPDREEGDPRRGRVDALGPPERQVDQGEDGQREHGGDLRQRGQR